MNTTMFGLPTTTTYAAFMMLGFGPSIPIDLSGLLGRSSAFLCEVGRNCDDGTVDLADLTLSLANQVGQDHCGETLRRVNLTVDFVLPFIAHVDFDELHHAVGPKLGLLKCKVPNDDFIVVEEDH